jgi:hypothetical protein
MASRGDRPDISKSREWRKPDEYADRGVTERPVSKHHWKRDDTQVDAVPELHYRPGRSN